MFMNKMSFCQSCSLSILSPDFGASSNGMILDMVRVMQFALSQGRVAIHCHAGLGKLILQKVAGSSFIQ